jgi:hypothetical protein
VEKSADPHVIGHYPPVPFCAIPIDTFATGRL